MNKKRWIRKGIWHIGVGLCVVFLCIQVLSLSIKGEAKGEETSQLAQSYSDTQKEELQEEYMQSLEKQWKNVDKVKNGVSFSDCVKQVLAGEEENVAKQGMDWLINNVKSDMASQKESLVQLFFLGVMSAFFVDFSNRFLKQDLGETGYLAIYVMMFSVILTSFRQVYMVGDGAITAMADGIAVLTPVYANALLMAGKYQTAVGYYSCLVGGIGIVQWLVKEILFPVIFFYFVLQMLNYSMVEDRFSKLAAFLKQAVLWTLRFLFGLVTGMQVVQALLLPVSDQAKASNFSKSLAAIPGLGASARALTSTVFNSALVVKNAVGIAVMLFFVVLVAVPCIKIFLFIMGYQLISALLQPVAQKRVANLLYAASNSAKLLFQAVVTCAGLFLIGIVIVTAATSGAS